MCAFNISGPAIPAGPGPASRRLCLWFIFHLTLPPHPFGYHWYLFFLLPSSFLRPPPLFLSPPGILFRFPLLRFHRCLSRRYPFFLLLSFLHQSYHLSFFSLCCHSLLFPFGMRSFDSLANFGTGRHRQLIMGFGVVVVGRKFFRPDDASQKFLSTKSHDYSIGLRVRPKGGNTIIYHFH